MCFDHNPGIAGLMLINYKVLTVYVYNGSETVWSSWTGHQSNSGPTQ